MRSENDTLKIALELMNGGEYKKAAEMLLSVPEPSALALFQAAICLMREEDYDKAEQCLLKNVEAEPSLEAYELLAAIYDIKKDKKAARGAYEQMLKLSPKHERAMLYCIALQNDEEQDLEGCIRIHGYTELLFEADCFGKYNKHIVIDALNVMMSIANKLKDRDRALACFDKIRGLIPPEDRNNPYYRSLVASVYSQTIYSYHHSDDEQIAIMREMYDVHIPEHENSIKRDTSAFRQIKIAFLSNDLRFHPIGRFLLSLFEVNIPNTRILYYCYDTCDNDKYENDVIAVELKKRADKFQKVGRLTPDETEELILKDEIDILFDLNGVSAGNKRDLVIRRLAEIQLTWIGFPCTSGIRNVDYIIVDPVTDPPEYAGRFYTEKLAFMDKTFLCYPLMYRDEDALALLEPPFLKNGYITFGTFNNADKYTQRTLRMWAEILRRLPAARIRVVCSTANDDISGYGLKENFRKSGIDMTRVDFEPPIGFAKYLPLYNSVDIVLDTSPFNGATTTCDAFMMGVPVVSLIGVKHWERVGLDMLGHVGLADLAAHTENEYIETAVRLAEDKERLKALKTSLRGTLKASPLADTTAFKREFEHLMRRLFIEYCCGNKTKPAAKSEKELFNEIVCGLCFFDRYDYNTRDASVITHAKNELYSLQTRFIRFLPDNEERAAYKKALPLLFAARDFDAIRSVARACADLLAICVTGRDYT